MLRVAVVGTGWWGTELGKAAAALPGSVGIAGCFSLSQQECARFQAAFGGRIYPGYEELLADREVEAVILATPHSTHWRQVIQAAQAGKHVFCEKPLSLTVQTGALAVEACAKAGVVLAVGHNRRYLPAPRKMKALLEAGELGRVLHIEAGYGSNAAFSRAPTHWRSQRAEMPCGGIAPMALHVVDTFTWLLGPVVRLACVSKRQVSPVDIDDTCAALFELASGATGSLASLMAGPMSSHLHIYGSKARLESREFAELTLTPLAAGEPRMELRFSGDDSLQQELAALEAAVAGKAAFPVRPEEALRNVAVMEALQASSEAGGAWTRVAA